MTRPRATYFAGATIAVGIGILSHSWLVGIACVMAAALLGAALDRAERH